MIPAPWRQRLQQQAERRRTLGRDRAIHPASGADFCSNDYLGLRRDPRLAEAAAAAAREHGTGAGGARLLRGTTPLHDELEAALAASPCLPVRIVFKPDQQTAIEAVLRKFQAAPWNTPSPKEAEQLVGADVLMALIDLGHVVKLSEDVIVLAETYQSAVEKIRAHLIAQKTITVAQVRDLFNTSRKYALALMEYLDDQRITRRVGDERVIL